jgi:hypothetical protein
MDLIISRANNRISTMDIKIYLNSVHFKIEIGQFKAKDLESIFANLLTFLGKEKNNNKHGI